MNMSDITKLVNDAWLKINEGIGNAASSIAAATKSKANEINLQSKREELLKSLAPRVLKAWKDGQKFPEDIEKLLVELTQLDEQLETLKPEESSPKQEPIPTITPENIADADERQAETESTESDNHAACSTDEVKADDSNANLQDGLQTFRTDIPTMAHTTDTVEYSAACAVSSEENLVDQPSVEEEKEPEDGETNNCPMMSQEDQEDANENSKADFAKDADEESVCENDTDHLSDETVQDIHDKIQDAAETVGNKLDDSMKQASQQIDSFVETLSHGVGKAFNAIGNFLDDIGKNKNNDAE
jgi:hypothetical protein